MQENANWYHQPTINILLWLILKAKIVIRNKMSHGKEIAEGFSKRRCCSPLDVNFTCQRPVVLTAFQTPSGTANTSAFGRLPLVKEVCCYRKINILIKTCLWLVFFNLCPYQSLLTPKRPQLSSSSLLCPCLWLVSSCIGKSTISFPLPTTKPWREEPVWCTTRCFS